VAGPSKYDQWLKEERDREAMDADQPRRRALATRRSEIGFGEDVAGAFTRGITKPATSMARGVGWITKKLTGGRFGQGAEDWADRSDEAIAEYTGTRTGGTGMTPESEALDPGMAGWAEVPARLLGEVAQTAVGGGGIKHLLTGARASRVIPKVASTLQRWEKGGAAARTAASGVPFLPVDVVQGAGSAFEDEEGNLGGFVLPGRGGAAVENVLMGNVPMYGIEKGIDAVRGARSARAFDESLARAEARSAPYRYAKERNVAEVRPSRLLAAQSEPFRPTSGDRTGPGIPMPEASFVSRDVPETRAERLLAYSEPRPTAGTEPVGPAIPTGAVAPDIEGMFGVVPPERRLGRGPLVTPPPVDPMEEALKYSRGRQAERAARGESTFDMHDFMARRRGEPTAEEVERAAMRGDAVDVAPTTVRPAKNAEGYFEDVRTGSGVYRKMSRVSNEGLLRQLAEYADERLGTVSHTPAAKAMVKRLDEIEGELERRGLTQDQIWGPELEKVRAQRAAAKQAEQEAADSYVAGDEDTSFDFGPRAGATRQVVVNTLGGGAVFGTAGSFVGDTPEERQRNAGLGFMVGSAGGAGAMAAPGIVRRTVRNLKDRRFQRALQEGKDAATAAGAQPWQAEALIEAGAPPVGAQWRASPRGKTGAVGDVEKVGGSGSPMGKNRAPEKVPVGDVDAESTSPDYIPTVDAVKFARQTLGADEFEKVVRSIPASASTDPATVAMMTEQAAREVVAKAQGKTVRYPQTNIWGAAEAVTPARRLVLPEHLREGYEAGSTDADILAEELYSGAYWDRTPTQAMMNAQDEIGKFAEAFTAADRPLSELRAAARAHAREALSTKAERQAFLGSVDDLLVRAETPRPRTGAVAPAVASTVGGAAVGGVAGSTVGDTPEKRKRNAVAGVLVGAGAGAGAARTVSRISRRTAAVAAKASTPALTKAASMVAAGERSVAKGATFLTDAEKAYTDLVDEAFPLSKFGREYDQQNPERLAETVAQGQGWRGQARVYMDERYRPILERIKGREADVQGYVVAKREQQLRAQGAAPKTTMTDAEIAAAVRDGDADPVLAQAQKDLTAAYRDLLTMRRNVGLLDPDKYDAIIASEDFYTAFTREWGGETGAKGGNSAGKFINRGAGVRKMDREAIANAAITDPLERLVLDATDTFRQVAKQKVTNVVGEIVEQMPGGGGVPGLLREVKPGDTPKPTARIVEPMVGGARKRYEVTDPDFYDAWASFDPRTMGIAEKIGSYFKRTLQAGVTLLPDFAIANLVRDTGGAAIQQPTKKLLKRAAGGAAVGAVAGAATADEDESKFVRALAGAGIGSGVSSLGPQVLKALGATKSILTNDATYKEFLKSGASTEGFYPKNMDDARKVLKDLRRNGVEASDLINPVRWKDALYYIGSVAEQSTRVAKFSEMRRAGASTGQAALGAQDVSLRFANIGKRTKGIASVTPFWNAGVQGWDKLTRMIKDPRTAAAGIATLTAPTMALWAVNKDNEEYWARPQWERNMFWLIPKEEGGFYRLAKPFQIGFLFASLPERLADFAYQKAQGNDAKPGETFRSAAFDMLATTFEGTMPVPLALGVAAEEAANYDAFRGRPIVSRPDLPAEMQHDERTSFLAKTVGEKTGTSPQRIDHVTRALTGSAGTVALGAVDAAARRVGLDDRANPAPGVPLLARRFVTNDLGTTDQEQTLRRRFADADRVYRGARQLEAEVTKAGGDPAKLKAYVDEHKEELLAREQMEQAVKKLNYYADMRKALRKDRRIDAAARQEQLQVLRLLGQELAQRALAPTPTTSARATP
jgi:hypothetical protein